MGQFQAARQAFEKSLSLEPACYQTIRELMAVLIKLDDRDATLALMGRLLRLDPHNPTVFNDCFEFARHGPVSFANLLVLFDTLKAEHPDDQLFRANCDFYAGQFLMGSDPVSAKQRFTAANRVFRQILPGKHQVFAALRAAFAQVRHTTRPS
jgi:tetratricopeptide (TPR) repeat protein